MAFEGIARIDLGSVNVSRYAISSYSAANVDFQCEMETDVLATGGSHFLQLVARYADTDNNYLARLAFNTTQTLTLTLRKRVTGTETLLATATLPNYVHAADKKFTVRFSVSGSTLSAKVWPTFSGEPVDWQVTITDTDLASAGNIGIRAILSSTNTNTLPVRASFDQFFLASPQTFTVTRSTNGVVKAQSAGEDVALAYPMHLAL